MKALVCTKPGLLEYKEISKPSLEKDHALLRIKRIGVCGTDLHAYEGTQPYFNYPRILGHEISAEVADINGDNEFSIGDTVTIIPYIHCGNCVACRNGKTNCCVQLKVCGVHIDGGMAEYFSVPVKYLIHSDGLNTDELALTEPLSIGAHGIKRANVQNDEFVLVIGAGPIGLAAMQFAKIAKAKVIAMDINQSRLEFCKKNDLAHFIVNSAKEDPITKLASITNNDMPTVVIDATGSLHAINDAFRYIAHGGRYILIGLQKENISFSHPEFHKREAMLMSSRNATREDFEFVIDCIKRKTVQPLPFITHRINFDEISASFSTLLNPRNHVIKALIDVY